MARLAPKTCASARGRAGRPASRKCHFAAISLTFGACGGLTPAIIGKTFFSTRRPALEAGGQRPTARCALGRKSVWKVVSLRGLGVLGHQPLSRVTADKKRCCARDRA